VTRTALRVGRLPDLWPRIRSGDSYSLVLILLLASVFVGIASPEATWARVLRDVVLAGTALIAFWTATAQRPLLVPGVLVPGLAIALVLVGLVEGADTGVVGAAIGAALTALLTVLVARDLVARGRVDAQTVLGALSLYVLVAIVFASLFALVGELDDQAFFGNGIEATISEYLYFSFVTISTTGFGDLSAAARVGRALAVIEIVVGQLYLVTVVAVIVTTALGRAVVDRRSDG
jgi:hypothetical protein